MFEHLFLLQRITIVVRQFNLVLLHKLIHGELLMVRSFTIDSVDIYLMLHEPLRHYIGGTLHVLTAIQRLHSCVFQRNAGLLLLIFQS